MRERERERLAVTLYIEVCIRSELYREAFLSRPLFIPPREETITGLFKHSGLTRSSGHRSYPKKRNYQGTAQEASRFAVTETMALYGCSHAFAVK